MATILSSRRPADPTPHEIEERKAEILALRKSKPAETEEQAEERRRRGCVRVRQYRQRKKAETADPTLDEYEALAASADSRGVLSYYNINRGTQPPYHDLDHFEQVEMGPDDVANVEFLGFGDLDAVLDDIINATEAQHDLEDRLCVWSLRAVDPEIEDVAEPLPFKGRRTATRRSAL